ncbi:MAG: hypothetical protein IJO94_02000 [Firmicutes bacterium]|nr:hypothetical protein [Bacillota bacterium]MBQ6810160.1 hypothetical protein [Bacillota bacterium]
MKLEKNMVIPVSGCDHRAKATIPYLVSLFMDLATEHSEAMGIGKDAMDRTGLFWIAVRTKLKIHRLPERMESVTVATWPETPGRIRCNRYYTLKKDGKMLVEAKNEWAIIDLKSGRPQKLSALYPEGMEHLSDVVCEDPFGRFADDLLEGDIVDTYKVRSTDIDFGQHMNNVAYIRALFGAFSCKELEEKNITGLEVAYKAQSYEGDILTIRRRKTEDYADYAMIRENGDVAAIIRLTY